MGVTVKRNPVSQHALLQRESNAADDYPGHDEAARQWESHRSKTGAKAGEKKQFLRERFGVRNDVAHLVRAADRMASQGMHPPELVQIIEQCERLALAL